MQLVDVHVVRAQALKAPLQRRANVIGREVDPRGLSPIEVEAHLRGDEDVGAHRGERLADQFLAVAVAVDVGSVVEVDAEFERALEGGERLLVFDAPPHLAADGPAAEADLGDHEPGAAETAVVHRAIVEDGGWKMEDVGMRIVVAPQEYKGTLTAAEAAGAIAVGVRRALPDADVDLAPVSDGGPGLVDALLAATPGRLMSAAVQDPLGRDIEAQWALLDDRTAVIEMASAAGLVLLAEAERDPRITSTYGVGQLIGAALHAGASRIIVGVGGSATNDGGAGMAAALGVRFLNAEGRGLPPGGAALARLARIDASGIDLRIRNVRVIAATDVTNSLCGPDGASLVYGPQKGATFEIAKELDTALRRYGEVIERDLGVSVLDVPGAGAAGGLGAGLIAFLGAEVRPGFEIVAEVTRLAERIAEAHLVITGEGRLDGQTAYGKSVARVAGLAREASVAVIAVPGSLGEGWEVMSEALDTIAAVDGAGKEPAGALAETAERAVRRWLTK